MTTQKYCQVCGMPVFEAHGVWFHDVGDRFVATPARLVTDRQSSTISLPVL